MPISSNAGYEKVELNFIKSSEYPVLPKRNLHLCESNGYLEKSILHPIVTIPSAKYLEKM